MDRGKVKERRKSCSAKSRKEGRNGVCKMRRPIGMKIAVEDNKRCNIATMRMRPITIIQRREVDETKSFFFHLMYGRAV